MAERQGIAGRHAVLEALRSGREVHSLLIARDADPAALATIREEATRRGLTPQYVGRSELVRLAGGDLQGVGAVVAPLGDFGVRDLVARARGRSEPVFLVAVDGVSDVGNLGAIARTALLAGCHGLVVPERGTAAVGEGAHRAASGALSQLPVAKVANLRTALDTLRRDGVHVVGADAHGGKDPWAVDLRGDVCVVLGSEHEGLSKQALEAVETRVCIPTPGGDLSLNVSAAAAVLLFERVRQVRQREPARRG